MKISKYISDLSAVEEWLDNERESLESDWDFLHYSTTGEGITITLNGDNTGELHVKNNGHVSIHVEDSDGNVTYTSQSTASDEKTLHALFQNMKKKIGENT